MVAAVAFGWVTIRRGFSARDNPSTIETLVATTARQLAVPSQYRYLRNPLSLSSHLHTGMEHFAEVLLNLAPEARDDRANDGSTKCSHPDNRPIGFGDKGIGDAQ